MDDVWAYLTGNLTEDLSFQVGADKALNSNDIRLLDAEVRYEPTEVFRLRAGRMLLPLDRSNLAGPYFNTTYRFPLYVNRYPNIFLGRDNGAAVWGLLGGGILKYQVGAFEGRQGGSNQEDHLAYAGRLTLNLLDPERRYYHATTYYGRKEVLALGLAGMVQKDGAGTRGSPGEFTGWNIDLLYEDHMGPGVGTLEGAYYRYDRDGVRPVLPSNGLPRPDGDAYMALAAYLVQPRLGPGQVQPHIRYQRFETGAADQTRLEGGINYIIRGHSARLSLIVGEEDNNPFGADGTFFLMGIQGMI